MNRRTFIQNIGATACGAGLGLPSFAAPATPRLPADGPPLMLGGQRHMFIDEMLIAEMKGVSFQIHPPQMRETVLTPDAPNQQLSAYSSVIDDGTELKMYYATLGPNMVRLATSKDGIHREKPGSEGVRA